MARRFFLSNSIGHGTSAGMFLSLVFICLVHHVKALLITSTPYALPHEKLAPEISPSSANILRSSDPWYYYGRVNSYSYGSTNEYEWAKNLKYIKYHQMEIDNSEHHYSIDFLNEFFEYKEKILIGDSFQTNFYELCDNWSGRVSFSSCKINGLYEHMCIFQKLEKKRYNKYVLRLSNTCQEYLTMVSTLIFMEPSILPSFAEKCNPVAEYIDCGRKSIFPKIIKNSTLWESNVSTNGIDCYIQGLFDKPIDDVLLERFETNFSSCAIEVMKMTEFMFQDVVKYDKSFYDMCSGSSWFQPLCYPTDEFEYIKCRIKQSNYSGNLWNEKCLSALNSRVLMISKNSKLHPSLNIRNEKGECQKAIALHRCDSMDPNVKIPPFDVLNCLVENKNNKTNGYINLFDTRSELYGSDNLNPFTSQCKLKMKILQEEFVEEPRFIPDLHIDCGQEIKVYCSKVPRSELVHCLMLSSWSVPNYYPVQFSNTCYTALDKIVRITEIGVQPIFDELLYTACKDRLKNCYSNAKIKCISENILNKNLYLDLGSNDTRFNLLAINYPMNMDDLCVRHYTEFMYFQKRNVPKDIAHGSVQRCEVEGKIENKKIDWNTKKKEQTSNYSGPNPGLLLQPYYILEKNMPGIYYNGKYSCNTFSSNTYWTIKFCPKNSSTIEQIAQSTLLRENYNRSNYIWGHFSMDELLRSGKSFDTDHPPVRIKDGLARPYFTVYYKNGTICEETGNPRMATILHFCNENYSTIYQYNDIYDYFVSSPCEKSICKYEIEVYSPHLCMHPSFRPYNISSDDSQNLTTKAKIDSNPFTWKRNPFTYSWKKENPKIPMTSTYSPYWEPVNMYPMSSTRGWWDRTRRYMYNNTKNWWNRESSPTKSPDRWNWWYSTTTANWWYRPNSVQPTQNWWRNWYPSTENWLNRWGYSTYNQWGMATRAPYTQIGFYEWMFVISIVGFVVLAVFGAVKYEKYIKNKVSWPAPNEYHEVLTQPEQQQNILHI